MMPGHPAERGLSDRFLKAYNQLDLSLRKEFGIDQFETHSALLQKKAGRSVEFRARLTELSRFSELRNAIVHWYGAAGIDQAIAEPHREIVERYERLVQSVLQPAKALTIAVPRNKIYTGTLESSALTVIREMHGNVFTHIPVLDRNTLTGVFSENTVLSYLAVHEIVGIDASITLREFQQFLPISAHQSESFAFVSRNASVSEVVVLFRDSLQQKKRLGAVFITSTGNCTGELVGLITPWDVAGADPASGL